MTEGPELPVGRNDARTSAPDPTPPGAVPHGPLWWALLVLPLWLVLILCTCWEPVMGDGWSHIVWHRDNTLGLSTIYDFCRQTYLHENPRLGQFLTMLVYTRGPYHAIITPIVELGGFTALTVLALGRWPHVWRSEDAFVAALVTALVVTCAPQIGPLLFYRPFTGNYVFGLALNLWWLVPYRLALAAGGPARVDHRDRHRPWQGIWHNLWRAPLMLVLGLAAGLSNEHTGFAFLAMGLLASFVARRRGSLRGWMIVGLIGMAAGTWLLLTAPGQHERYEGLAGQAGILGRITGRGVAGNLRVLRMLALALVPALPLVGIVFLDRWTTRRSIRPSSATDRWTFLVLALGGLACTVTLLGSPKIGPRLYLASIALIAAGLAGWSATQLRGTWARRGCALLAAGVLVLFSVRFVTIYRVVGPLWAIRRDRLEHGAPGSVVTVPRYPFDGDRFFLGDDFLYPPRREDIAIMYGLKAIEFAAPDDR